jgi:hypothetical protein
MSRLGAGYVREMPLKPDKKEGLDMSGKALWNTVRGAYMSSLT